MVRGKAKNPRYIILSSSEDEEEEEEDDDDDDEEEISSSSSSEWSDEEEEDDDSGDDDDDAYDDDDDDEEDDDSQSNTIHNQKTQYGRVVQLLKGGGDLEPLKLEECKAYLREHDLRLAGNKAVCIQRIQEHLRIKDGNGEKLYPRSSFSINCTGDVCKGDVVIFTQRVYGKFDKVTRNGNLLGKRTVAGRVVKESYGTAKQQHTFTVEVLWSKGVKQLPPLSSLLVKGRNLYRLKTYRQRWDNEAERSKVLAEKHKRGAAAREVRARRKAGHENKGAKRSRHSHHTGRSPKRRRRQEPGPLTRKETGKHGKGKAPLVKQPESKKNDNQAEKRLPGFTRPTQPNENPFLHPLSVNRHPMNVPLHHTSGGAFYLSNGNVGSTSAMRATNPRHYASAAAMPMFQQDFNHRSSGNYAYSGSSYHLDPRNLNHHRNQVAYSRIESLRAGQYSGLAGGPLRCSTPGCGDLQADYCVVSSCWRCCRGKGRICPIHRN